VAALVKFISLKLYILLYERKHFIAIERRIASIFIFSSPNFIVQKVILMDFVVEIVCSLIIIIIIIDTKRMKIKKMVMLF
jgi:hypothetical protein